jgi:hypothetical protein
MNSIKAGNTITATHDESGLQFIPHPTDPNLFILNSRDARLHKSVSPATNVDNYETEDCRDLMVGFD